MWLWRKFHVFRWIYSRETIPAKNWILWISTNIYKCEWYINIWERIMMWYIVIIHARFWHRSYHTFHLILQIWCWMEKNAWFYFHLSSETPTSYCIYTVVNVFSFHFIWLIYTYIIRYKLSSPIRITGMADILPLVISGAWLTHCDWHFPGGIFKYISFNENVRISFKISLWFVPKDPLNNIPALVQIMA